MNPDSDGDAGVDGPDNCPSVPNDQADSDMDGVGQACDTCPSVANAPVPAATIQSWMTLVSGQRDDDGDGLGNRCDFDHDQAGTVITSSDFNHKKVSVGKLVSLAMGCGVGGGLRCGKFDHDGAGAVLSATDFNLLKAQVGKLKAATCGAACTRPINVIGKAMCAGPSC